MVSTLDTRQREREARSRADSVTLENMRISDRNSSVFEAAQRFVTHRCSVPRCTLRLKRGGGGEEMAECGTVGFNTGALITRCPVPPLIAATYLRCRNEPRGRGGRRVAALVARRESSPLETTLPRRDDA